MPWRDNNTILFKENTMFKCIWGTYDISIFDVQGGLYQYNDQCSLTLCVVDEFGYDLSFDEWRMVVLPVGWIWKGVF